MIQYILHALWPNPEIFIWCEWFFVLLNSPIDFVGLSGLPMKVKLIVSLMFLLYGPKHQAWPSRRFCTVMSKAVAFSLFSSHDTCFSPSTAIGKAMLTVCTKHVQPALARGRHLSYFTRSASWNPCLDLHPDKWLNLWKLNFLSFLEPYSCVLSSAWELKYYCSVFLPATVVLVTT